MKRFSDRFFGGNRVEKNPAATNGTANGDAPASTGEPTVAVAETADTMEEIEVLVDGAEAADGALLGVETEPEAAEASEDNDTTPAETDVAETAPSETTSSEPSEFLVADTPEPKLPLLGQASVQVKGWRNGLLLYVPTFGQWDDVLADVDARLDEARARSFWRGAQTTVICGIRAVSLDDLTLLCDRIKEGWGLVPVALVATDSATRAAGEKLALVSYKELPVVTPGERRERPAPPKSAAVKSETNNAPQPSARTPQPAPVPEAQTGNALYVPSTLRSGQRVAHIGHVVVCGDVNAGAEVIATGDVLIFGTLRGLAHAGSEGNEAARIIATNLRPPQLRIAGKIARAPEEPKKTPGGAQTARPEVARIENGEIGVFPL